MKVKELPQEIQDLIAKERSELSDINNYRLVLLYDKTKRIFFMAKRQWTSGPRHAYDGIQYWSVCCGKVVVKHTQKFGVDEYHIVKKKCFNTYGDGKSIPSVLQTKQEVIALAKDMGYFDI